ncbi:MAG: YgfZ/GcvT domain-containing protein [Ilumatobacteraceae bacterium]
MTDPVLRWADSVWATGPRDRLVVEGPDAARYLHSQLAQDIESIDVGGRRWSLLLEPTGRVVALLGVERSGPERFVLDADPGSARHIEERLRRFMLRVTLTLEVEEAPGPVADEVEAERVRHGWPRVGSDIVSGETLPAETGLIAVAVSFTKGCYPGQELVERMDSRAASAPFGLVRLVGPGHVPGAAVLVDGVDVGRVTSATYDAAIARVRRSADIGDPIAVGR